MYDDYKLCPENFEQMAKEYSKILKEKNTSINNEMFLSKINSLIEYIKQNICYLKKLKNLNRRNRYYITKANDLFLKFLETEDFETKQINSNYCFSLEKTIDYCCNLVKLCNKFDKEKQKYDTNLILEMIIMLSKMFGVCKFRK